MSDLNLCQFIGRLLDHTENDGAKHRRGRRRNNMRPLILFLLLCASAHDGERYWFRDRLPVEHVTVMYADKFACGTVEDALGCFTAWGDFGVITVKRGLPAYVEACVRAHERHHQAGYDHVSMPMPFIDCGNGQWLSGETLSKLGYCDRL